MRATERLSSRLGLFFSESKMGPLVEILTVFAVAGLVLGAGLPWVGDNPLRFQGVVWVANVLMLSTIWILLRLRGDEPAALGLPFAWPSARGVWGAAWKSVLVFVSTLVAWGVGAVIMVNIVGRPEPADMSGYNYLSGNLPMLFLVLAGVFIASSVGEEVLYRGFLVHRLEELGGGGSAALKVAIAVSSIIFGLIHFAWGPMGMVQTAFMGLALAVSYVILNRNLWIPVLAHFYLDAILMIQMYLAPPG